MCVTCLPYVPVPNYVNISILNSSGSPIKSIKVHPLVECGEIDSILTELGYHGNQWWFG